MELQKKLDKLGKPATEAKAVMKSVRPNDGLNRIASEMKQLEEQKKGLKGFGGFIKGLGINKEINLRKQALHAPYMKAKAESAEHQLREAKARQQMAEMKRKSMITMDDLTGKTSGVKF